MSGPRVDSIRPRSSRNVGPPPGPDVFPSLTSEIKTSLPVNICPPVCLSDRIRELHFLLRTSSSGHSTCLYLWSLSIESRFRSYYLMSGRCVFFFWTQTSYSCCAIGLLTVRHILSTISFKTVVFILVILMFWILNENFANWKIKYVHIVYMLRQSLTSKVRLSSKKAFSLTSTFYKLKKTLYML